MSGFWWGFWWGAVTVSAFMAIAPDGGRLVSRFFAQIGWLAYRASMATLNRQRRIEQESPVSAAHPWEADWTWETACRCGLRYCRSGWPADAPLPADLPDPLPFLREKLAAGQESR